MVIIMYADIQTERNGFLKINSINFDCVTKEIPRARWEYMERGDSVCILAFNEDTMKFVVIKQFRAGEFVRTGITQSYSNPAGMIDDGETPLQAAIRELNEEIGVNPYHITELGSGYPSVGGCSEKSYFFFAKFKDQKPKVIDTDEGITIVEMKASEYRQKISNGEISSLQMQHAFMLWDYHENI